MASATPSYQDASFDDASRSLAIIVYGLYLAAALTCGAAGIAGVIVAYIKRDSVRGTPWESHFENAIQAFWIWVVLMAAGIVAVPLLGLGFVVMGGAFVYFLYRTLKGLMAAVESRPYV